MGIFIKNPEVERKVRELARRRGVSITAAIGEAFDRELALEEAAARKRPRPTLAELRAATDEFRRVAGLDKVKLNVTKADFDALWEIPGFDPEDDQS
jgi:antitoxin VapB